MTYTARDIIGALPHGFPFLMVDRVLEVVPGRRAVAVKTMTAGGFFSSGRPAAWTPEMFVIEAMAQVGALTVAADSRECSAGPGEIEGSGGITGYLAGLNDVIFHKRPMAGDTLVLTMEFVAAIGPLARFRGEARISGELAVEAGLTFTAERAKNDIENNR